ncbi:hypothetical protein NCAS_0G04210 [Naumovozyma castellii]|uniref:Uncharacterized protein n=1 Tax=Naumovozyma castellii TaxID=27288 RepID=G0VHK1_NAUCA|nr:hypothetical protein NCAS_0G04210 [Naumovozyma castellii CBS 4309]CCC71308.1 hypothetical protein NCAS_0G04210 [Naumovozyma castellii CBS 4309]
MSIQLPAFISLIDENSKPITIYVPPSASNDVNEILKYNVLSNIAIDYFDSILIQWDTSELPPVKTLFQVEGISVFGMLIKQTALKIVIGFNTCFKEDDVNLIETFKIVKKIYIRVKSNPFNKESSDQNGLTEHLNAKFDKEFSSSIDINSSTKS